LDEYHFQVNLNWSRSQYFFVLNVALLAAGVGLLSSERIPLAVAMAIFSVGAISTVLAMLATATQRSYYENTRDRKRQLETRLGLGEHAIAPTPGMGAIRGRIARVTTFQAFMLAALLAADLAGLGTSIAKAFPSGRASAVVVAVHVELAHPRRSARSIPIVASEAGKVTTTGSVQDDRTAMLRLMPGRYRIAAWTGQLCQRTANVSSAPLQGVRLRCP
jgi:hypothetical protein